MNALGSISTFSKDPRFSSPGHIAVDLLDDLCVVDSGACAVSKINQAGQVTVFIGVANQCGYNAGISGMKATAAYLNLPYGLGFDAVGRLYIADSGNSLIRKVNQAGMITTIAGTQGTFRFTGDGGQGSLNTTASRPRSAGSLG